MNDNDKITVLDHGYIKLIESWGSDAHIIEAARMSTAKGFQGWGPVECGCARDFCPRCGGTGRVPGDEKLLAHLWNKKHSSPFEFAGLVIEVQAPIFVFREWHRHRTWSYSERSARYTPLPDLVYTPSVERLLEVNNHTGNTQAQGKHPGHKLNHDNAVIWQGAYKTTMAQVEVLYKMGLSMGVAKELARAPLPVARYSVMRATANLHNVLKFLGLRCAPDAQWEIRQYANELAEIVRERFPRTHEVARESLGLPRGRAAAG